MSAAAGPGLSRPQLLSMAAAVALVPLNSTMIAVALPRIATDFDISVGRTSLLVTVYLVAMLVGQPLAGRLSDAVGADRAVRVALVSFLGASLLGAFAPAFGVLVVARLGQAAAGAALVPSVQAILRSTTTAASRGQTFGLLGSMLGVGAAGGPVVGGALIQAFGWQAIFLVNVPVVLVALAVRLVPVVDGAPTAPETAARVSWRNVVFVAAFAMQALTTLGQYLLLLLTPVLLDARGWSSGSVGLVLSALTVGMIVMGPVGGRAADLFGRRAPTTAGIAACVLALGVAASAGAGTSIIVLVGVLAVFGTGLGFAIPGLTTAALESVDERRTGTAAGVLSMSRYVGSITTSLLVAAWIGSDGSGAGATLTLAAAAALVALALTAALPGRAPVPASLTD